MAEPEDKQGKKPRERRLWLSTSVFFAVLFLALALHRCQEEAPPPNSALPPIHQGSGPADTMKTIPPETTITSVPPSQPEIPVAPNLVKTVPPKTSHTTPKPVDSVPLVKTITMVDSGPYIYADPWGGRHFDSVSVSLHCREDCLLLYSLEDSIHFKSYDAPFLFRRNTTLWISGLDSLNRQVAPIRVDYVIERNPGACAKNTLPVEVKGKNICMDIYEWPNREGEIPRTFVSQQDAADSCRQAGKRLCSQEEWQQTCQGPDHAAYPYGGKYNENYCPAKEASAARSGRFPVCRSYYGVYDMTGNLWEWTSTPSQNDADFYMVMGGNWDAGNEATCHLAKFSFYPSVRYPFVGFRCCQEAR